MTFEGEQIQGAMKIMEKFKVRLFISIEWCNHLTWYSSITPLQSLTFQSIKHIITKVDCQPMFDGGILIVVLGQLKTDNDPPHPYSQTFVLKPIADSFFLQHDIFRLGIHSI